MILGGEIYGEGTRRTHDEPLIPSSCEASFASVMASVIMASSSLRHSEVQRNCTPCIGVIQGLSRCDIGLHGGIQGWGSCNQNITVLVV